MKNVIEIHDLKKYYVMGSETVKALNGVNLTIGEGEFVAIMGASGSGKSTMMNIVGCLDRMSEGEYILDGTRISTLHGDVFAEIRNKKIGFIFQSFNLLHRTSALENVELPLLYSKEKIYKKPLERAFECLKMVGLETRIHHIPTQLSGGQQQRVAIARALVNNPAIILADEPTGNLDTRSSIDIMRVFQELNDEGRTVIIVTHEHDIAQYAKRKVILMDGKIIRDETVQNRLDAKVMYDKIRESDDELLLYSENIN